MIRYPRCERDIQKLEAAYLVGTYLLFHTMVFIILILYCCSGAKKNKLYVYEVYAYAVCTSMWFWFLLAKNTARCYKAYPGLGKRSIDYPAQGKPSNILPPLERWDLWDVSADGSPYTVVRAYVPRLRSKSWGPRETCL